MFDTRLTLIALTSATLLPAMTVLLVKWRSAVQVARLRAVHKAYSLRQMAATERRRVW